MNQESGERGHSCPNCGSEEVRRSLCSGIAENIFYRMIGVRPYRYRACGERFFDRRGAPGRKENTRD